LPLLDDRSESPWESVMWVLHLAAGIEVEPQKEIFDQWGRFFARGDLWLVGTRRIHEYDGDVHRDRQTHRSDLGRATSYQLLNEGASIVASADRLLGRRWNPQRLCALGSVIRRLAFSAGRPRQSRTPLGRALTNCGRAAVCRTEMCHSSTASADEYERMTTGWLQG
jgi:hypothetical protein